MMRVDFTVLFTFKYVLVLVKAVRRSLVRVRHYLPPLVESSCC